MPLAVAISVLIQDNCILLIKRIKGDYAGLLGLPGGKVEKGEHVSETAVREVWEEAGIDSDFKDYLGLVSEQLVENGEVLDHFILHICQLQTKTLDIKHESEGQLAWYDLGKIIHIKKEVIPSDFLIIEKIVKDKEKIYFDCIVEKNNNKYSLKKFQ